MSEQTIQRLFLFDPRAAFASPVVMWITIGVAGALAIAPIVIHLLDRAGTIDRAHRAELMLRYRSWLVLVPLIMLPILLGAAYTILAVGGLSLMCYTEYARASGLFREKAISLVVVLGIAAITFAALDNWYELFVALWPLTVAAIAAVAILADRPKGYIQRVALGVLAFMLFGGCLGHLGYFANDTNYRAMLLWLLLCVEMNDIFAYIAGKTLGRRKLAPNTSPNKTITGAIGAIILTTVLAASLGHLVFRHSVLDAPLHLITLGVMISALGQFGDLLISSIKRDLEVKDMGRAIPGHGGLLDRFDSVLLVAPGVFHYVGYFIGVGLSEPARIFTGGGA